MWLPHVWLRFKIRNWREKRRCARMRCSYYFEPGTDPRRNLSHERFHVAERNLANWEETAARYIREGRAIPDYVAKMCWLYRRQVNP